MKALRGEGIPLEIERKWLCEGFPNEPWDSEELQTQGYLSFEPTVRIRAIEQRGAAAYVLTVKGKGALCRTEVELPLTKTQYEALAGMLAAPTVRKRLRRYPLPDGHTLECSLVDEGEAGAFYYAEVEFPSVEAARQFTPPPFLGREVTQEPAHTMAAYARRKAGGSTQPV